MTTPFAATLSAIVLLAASAPPAPAEVPRKRPLARYAMLWTSSPFLTGPPRAVADEEGEELAQKNREIAELRARIGVLEEELRRLKAGARENDPPREEQLANDQELLEWIRHHQSAPMAELKVVTAMEQLATREAQRRGLAVERRKILPVAAGAPFSRARIQVEVSGQEPVLYQWLDRLHSPADFRGLTMVRINPSRNDESQVDCLVQVESWFIAENTGAQERLQPDGKKQLQPLIDGNHYPLELMLQLAIARGKGGVRLARAEIRNELMEEHGLVRDLRIHGRADELAEVNTFNLKLQESPGLIEYRWTTPPPVETRDGRWAFVFDATIPSKESGE